MLRWFKHDYEADSMVVADTLVISRGRVEFAPMAPIFTPEHLEWLQRDSDYVALTLPNWTRLIRKYFTPMERYVEDVRDCDKHTHRWLETMFKAARREGLKRVPCMGKIDFFPKGSGDIDQAYHECGWFGFKGADGKLHMMLYEPQLKGHAAFMNPATSISKTVVFW